MEATSGDSARFATKAGPLGMTGIAERIWGVVQREDASDGGQGGMGDVKDSSRASLGLRPLKRRVDGGPPEDTRRSCLGPW